MRDRMRIINAKETQLILDKPRRTAYRRLTELREFYGKERKQPINIEEFCYYFNFKLEDVLQILKTHKN